MGTLDWSLPQSFKSVGYLFTVFKLKFKLASLKQDSFKWADTCALQSFPFCCMGISLKNWSYVIYLY